MTSALNIFGDSSILSRIEFNNPFKQGNITRICMFAHPGYQYGAPVSASVEFERGMTKGEQKFEGNTITEVLEQALAFCKQLE